MNHFKSQRALSIFEILVIVVLVLIVGALVFPALESNTFCGPRSQVKNDATQIATALNAYLSEYGRLPTPQPGNVNSAKLMNTLAGTLKADPDNPKEIVFLEVPKAKNHHNGAEMDAGPLYSSGFKDPWGNEYEIRVDTGTSAHPNTPSVEGPDGPVAKAVIVWSRGDPAKVRDYKDVTKWVKSWE